MAAGFETWKKQFAGEAQARVVSASTIAALMATTYSTATIAAQSKPLAIQKVAAAPSFGHSRSLGGLSSFAKCCEAASEPSRAARSYHSRALAGSG
jgi:hypothetical protein